MKKTVVNAGEPSLTRAFFKNGGVFVAIFTAAIISAIIFANYNFSLLGQIIEYPILSTYLAVAFGYSALVLLFYAVISAKTRKLTSAFPIGIGCILAGIVFFAYIIFVLQVFTLLRIAIAATLIVLGLLMASISGFFAKKGGNVEYGYFLSVIDRFSFPAIIMAAFAITSIVYALTWGKFFDILNTSFLGLSTIRICALITAGAFVLALVFSLVKKIDVGDFILLSVLVALPVVITNVVLFLNFNDYALYLFAPIALVIVITLLRNLIFHLKDKESTKAKGYCSAFADKYGLFAAAALGTVTFLALTVFLTTDLFKEIPLSFVGKARMFATYYPIAYTVVALGILFVVGFILSIASVGTKKVGAGDFFNVAYLLGAVKIIPFAILYSSVSWFKIAAIAIAAVSLIVFVIRFIVVSKTKKS